MLGTTHTPDNGSRTVIDQGAGDTLKLSARGSGYPLDFLGVPVFHLFADLLHAVHTGTDEFLVFPAVFEDVPEQSPNQGYVGTGPEAHIFVGMGRRAGEARVTNNKWRVVLFLGFQDVQQRHRMRLGRVAPDNENGLGIVDVVVRVGHRTVAPGVGYTGDCGGVADPGLVVDVIGAPVSRKFAVEIRLFVVELRAAQPVHRIRAALIANLQHLVADFVDGLVPGDLLPLAIDHFHGVLQAPLAVGVFTHRSALGAV